MTSHTLDDAAGPVPDESELVTTGGRPDAASPEPARDLAGSAA